MMTVPRQKFCQARMSKCKVFLRLSLIVLIYAGRVSDGAALIMRAIAESGATAAAPMREVALSEGAVLHHLCLGLSSRVLYLACLATYELKIILSSRCLVKYLKPQTGCSRALCQQFLGRGFVQVHSFGHNCLAYRSFQESHFQNIILHLAGHAHPLLA